MKFLWAMELAYHVCSDELASPQHVDPYAKQIDKFDSIVVGWKVVLQDALKSVHFGEHGKQQSVEIASYGASIFCANHLDTGIVGDQDARRCLLLNVDKIGRSFGVAISKSGGHDISDMVDGDIRNVQPVEAPLYVFDLRWSGKVSHFGRAWLERTLRLSFSASDSSLGCDLAWSALKMDMKPSAASGRDWWVKSRLACCLSELAAGKECECLIQTKTSEHIPCSHAADLICFCGASHSCRAS